MPSIRSTAALVVVMLALAGAPAAAQETVSAGSAATSAVKVTHDRAPVWTRNPSMVLVFVPAGTVLRAVSRDDKWYEVIVPERLAGQGGTARGFIYARYVELVPGSPEAPARAARGNDSTWAPVGPGEGIGTVTTTAPVARPAFGLRGFGSVSYMFFRAQQSFEAVLGSSAQPFFGGGAQVVFADRFFVSGGVERFRKTGERVFVSDGEVFKLGIDDTVTITPITVTAGYRFRSTDRFVPYLGGGAGVYQFKEVSEGADASENVDERFTSYHGLAGIEYTAAKWLFAAFEVQYTSVPNSLGVSGVSADFDEKNLGGLSLQLKVLVGR